MADSLSYAEDGIVSFRWIFLEDQIIYDIVRLPTVCVAEASVSFFKFMILTHSIIISLL